MTPEKPSLEELAHFGVLGMKWGRRKSATAGEIVTARKSLKAKSSAYRKNYKKLDNYAPGSVKRKVFEKKLNEQHQAYLKDPKRAIASRMTRGEKISSLMLGNTTLAGTVISVGTIAATSAASRRIEFKQDRGDYNKMDSGRKVQGHIGFQRQRSALVIGASVAPGILKVAGTVAAKSLGGKVAAKAAANRAAAKAGPRAIGALPKLTKANRGGVYNITSMK